MPVVTNANTKQIKVVLQNWLFYIGCGARKAYETAWWDNDYPSQMTVWHGDRKYRAYEKWLKRISAFIYWTDATYEQAEAHFGPLVSETWFYQQRSHLTGILTVCFRGMPYLKSDSGEDHSWLVLHVDDLVNAQKVKADNEKNDLKRFEKLFSQFMEQQKAA